MGLQSSIANDQSLRLRTLTSLLRQTQNPSVQTFNACDTTMPASAWIKDSTTATFEADVIKKSFELPVVVDFWAPWCQPCKQLAPVLEKLADEYAGKFLLVKVNIEVEQQIAQAFQIQSIPLVVAFREGQLVNEFAGLLPESQLRQWLETFLPSAAQMAMMAGMKLEETDPPEPKPSTARH